MIRIAGTLCLMALAVACSTPTTAPPDAADDTTSDVVRVADTPAATVDLVEVFDWGSGDAGDSTFLACDPGEGCFMDLCDENADCLSGWCVEHLGEGRCTTICQEECAEGWTCQEVSWAAPDVLFVCLSRLANLCKPCHSSTDCDAGATADVCVDYGDDGNFCGGNCEEDGDCPTGYACQSAISTEGNESMQCVRNDGECPCAQKSASQALTTTCAVENGEGRCLGVRTCLEEGLSECDALTPEVEVCDGIDNNCDGAMDEGTCDDDDICTDDACVDGECQFVPNTDPCDDGNQCTIDDKCAEGTCAGKPGGCDCQEETDCEQFEDGDLCTGTLYCNLDEFPYQCAIVEGSVVTCSEPEGIDAPCLNATCDPDTGECSFVPVEDGAPCNDEDPCTVSESCVNGQCTGGDAPNCNDGNPCTDDTCEAGVGCVNETNTAPCQDGNVCTVDDACLDGECAPGTPLSCDDDNPCTDDACDTDAGCQHVANDAECTDNTVCTDGDWCVDGSCKPGPAVDCDDDNPCTDDWCDAIVGCLHSNNANGCDDGDACTTGDVCADGACAGPGTLNCDDGNPCTDDGCDSLSGCTYSPNTLACDDGSACTDGDVCADGSCQSGQTIDCDDDNLCTNDSCDPDSGCVNSANTLPCSDTNPCTLVDQCKDGECVPGAELNCDDSNVCTDDSCINDNGAPKCLHVPNAAPCGEGYLCANGSCNCVPDCEGKICGPDSCGGFCWEGDLPLCEKQKGVCEGAVKIEADCINGAWGACKKSNYFFQSNAYQEAETLCDLMDNDCDGAVDEGLGETTCGLGVCEHTVQNCLNGETQQCDPLEGKSDEVCDSKDNDCDGLTDEGLGTTVCGVGPCLHAQDNCENGGLTDCDPLKGATDEVLDGIDNDCDGDTDEGFPVKGTILITELMANPDCVNDDFGEWVELYNPGDDAWDLNGWILKDVDNDKITIDNGGPLMIAPKDYLVLGRNGDTLTNGNVTLDYVYNGNKFQIANGADEAILVGPGGVEVDKVDWASGFPSLAKSQSLALHSDKYDADLNDVGDSWFLSTVPIDGGCGDKGTPGAANE